MTDNTQLLPCPFCGGAPVLHHIEQHSHNLMLNGQPIMPDHPGSWTIECCDVGMIKDTRDQVVTAWNKRSGLVVSDEQIVKTLADHGIGHVVFSEVDQDGKVIPFTGSDAETYCKAICALLSAAPKVPEWISVKDRLPPFGECLRVLIYTEGSEFAGEQFFDVNADSLNECFYEQPEDMPEVCQHATHWMPLPAAPQHDKE
ncbi:MAG TPA: DUF551 domain-containing protein [Noviherbaspirillum sp.]|nr:DUF551 domain-containing protein [Noviherbaspirillum sp.]